MLDIENRFSGSLTEVQARIAALRMLVSRLGEDDAWSLWNSSIWTRGHIVLRPIFTETWPRQRVLLAIAAASIATSSSDAEVTSSLARVFKLNPTFDATLQRSMMLIGVDVYKGIGAVVDQLPWSQVQSLEPLIALGRPDGSSADALVELVCKVNTYLGGVSRSDPWAPGIVT